MSEVKWDQGVATIDGSDVHAYPFLGKISVWVMNDKTGLSHEVTADGARAIAARLTELADSIENSQ